MYQIMILMLLTISIFSGCSVERNNRNDSAVALHDNSQKQFNDDGNNMEHEIQYSREMVIKKSKEIFPHESTSKILQILDDYGAQSYEAERERVHIAILKLSDGELEKLHKYVKIAKEDYRDVLGYAEYPLEMRAETWRMDAQAAEEIRKKDRKQYLEWLNENAR